MGSMLSSSVWPSNSAARADSHGASTGTSFDISSSSATVAASSGMIAGSGGAVPVGPVSLHSTRSPSMYATLSPSMTAETVPMPIRHALSNNIGLGGHNGAVIFKRYDGD